MWEEIKKDEIKKIHNNLTKITDKVIELLILEDKEIMELKEEELDEYRKARANISKLKDVEYYLFNLSQ